MGITAREPALFDVADAGVPTFEQPAAEKFWGADGAKWSQHRGAHQPCAVYVRLCQERGLLAVAKHLPATKRRVGPNGATYLCGMCAVDLQAQDKAAEAEAARRRATVEERAREIRASSRNVARNARTV